MRDNKNTCYFDAGILNNTLWLNVNVCLPDSINTVEYFKRQIALGDINNMGVLVKLNEKWFSHERNFTPVDYETEKNKLEKLRALKEQVRLLESTISVKDEYYSDVKN